MFAFITLSLLTCLYMRLMVVLLLLVSMLGNSVGVGVSMQIPEAAAAGCNQHSSSSSSQALLLHRSTPALVLSTQCCSACTFNGLKWFFNGFNGFQVVSNDLKWSPKQLMEHLMLNTAPMGGLASVWLMLYNFINMSIHICIHIIQCYTIFPVSLWNKKMGGL